MSRFPTDLTLTSAQRSALLGLVLEYVQDASKPGSRLPVEFVIIDENDTTVSMFDLLNLLARSTPPSLQWSKEIGWWDIDPGSRKQ